MAAQDKAQGLPSILLVDGDRDTVRVLERLLRLSGFDAVGVSTCVGALAVAGHKPFDLLLCDLSLGDGDGCELFRQLHERHGLAGIAYTGQDTPPDIERSLGAGFAAHLLKPIAFPTLLSSIGMALACRAAGPGGGGGAF